MMWKSAGLLVLLGTMSMSQDQQLDKNVLWAFRYPGATLIGTGSAGTTGTSGVYDTTDSYQKVFAFYAEKTGAPAQPKGGVASTPVLPDNRNRGFPNPTAGLVQEWGWPDTPAATFLISAPGTAGVVTIQETIDGTRVVVMLKSGR